MSREKKILLIIPTSLVLVLVTVGVIIACVGTPEPPECPKSIFLGKVGPPPVIVPPGGSDFEVPVTLFPFLSWSGGTDGCVDTPAFATATLLFLCTPIGGGATFPLSEQTFTLETPVVSGPQPLGGVPVSYSVPGGTPPSTCDVIGTYDVDFNTGAGVARLSATGDAKAFLVEPSPDNPELPGVNAEILLPPGNNGVFSVHQGDQEIFFIKLENNYLDHRAHLDLESMGVQVAGLPDNAGDEEAAYGTGFFGIANEADVWPISDFVPGSSDMQFDPLPITPGPQKHDARTTQGPLTEITLEPGEVAVYAFAMRTYGACAEGSCNEWVFSFEADLEPVGESAAKGAVQGMTYGGASLILYTREMQPRFPNLPVRSKITFGPTLDGFLSLVDFLNATGDRIDGTHRHNLLPSAQLGDLKVRLSGADVPNTPWPRTWEEEVTMDEVVVGARWKAFGAYAPFTTPFTTTTTVTGWDADQGDCTAPLISSELGEELDVTINGCGGDAPVTINGNDVGTLDIIRGNNTDNIFVDDGTTLGLVTPHGVLLSEPTLTSDVPAPVQYALSFQQTELVQMAITIKDQDGAPVDPDMVEILGPPGASVTPMGNGQVVVDFDEEEVTPGLTTYQWWVKVTKEGYLNSPFLIPVLVRWLEQQELTMTHSITAPPVVEIEDETGITICIPPHPLADWANARCLLRGPEGGTFSGDNLINITDPNDPALTAFQDAGVPGASDCSSQNACPIAIRSNVGDCVEILFTEQLPVAPLNKDFGAVNILQAFCAADNAANVSEAGVGFISLPPSNDLFVRGGDELRTALDILNDLTLTPTPPPTIHLTGGPSIPIIADAVLISHAPITVQGLADADKTSAEAAVTIDGSQCPAPCSGFVLAADSSTVANIRFQNFPDYGLVLAGDGSHRVSNVELADNGVGGLRIASSGNVVGDSLETANRFENNGGPGIVVASGTGNSLLFNTFPGHGRTAIDLGDDGLTPNDAGDADAGPNALQNFPALTNVLTGGSTTIQGTLDSTPNTSFTLQFFASDDSTTRANEVFLGEAAVTTDADGIAAFDVVVDGTAAIGQVVTATATDADSNTSEFSAFFTLTTGVAAEDEPGVPTRYTLSQNYPNPFNPLTTIRYDVPQASRVRLTLYDVLGRLVAVLADEQKAPGSYTVLFDARDLPSGPYFYTMTGDGFTQTRTLILLK